MKTEIASAEKKGRRDWSRRTPEQLSAKERLVRGAEHLEKAHEMLDGLSPENPLVKGCLDDLAALEKAHVALTDARGKAIASVRDALGISSEGTYQEIWASLRKRLSL